VLKKKIWANFQRIIELFTQKIVFKFSKIWAWDSRSGIQTKPIPDPGVKKAPDSGSGSATLLVVLVLLSHLPGCLIIDSTFAGGWFAVLKINVGDPDP
jgi:hypothetical protein